MARISVTAPASGGGDIGEDLEAIAALTPSNDDLIQRKGDTWVNRTPAQVKVDLAIDQYVPDNDIEDIGALSPADNDVLQRKSGEWTNRTPAQLKADMGIEATPGFVGGYKWGADF